MSLLHFLLFQDRDKRDREELLASNQAQLVDTTAIFIDPADLDHHSRLQQANGGMAEVSSLKKEA